MSDNVRIKNRSGYSAIPNKAMSDRAISIEARGLLALLLTFREGWNFNSKHLTKECGVGRDKFFKMTKELKDAGYLIVEKVQGDNGQFEGVQWELIPEPDTLKNRTTENADSGETDHIRDNNKKETLISKNPHTPKGDLFGSGQVSQQEAKADVEPDQFDEFWESYPPGRKTDRPKAKIAFDQIVAGNRAKKGIPKTDPGLIVAAVKRYAASQPDPQYVPLPTTWLNGARWDQWQHKATKRATSRDWEDVER